MATFGTSSLLTLLVLMASGFSAKDDEEEDEKVSSGQKIEPTAEEKEPTLNPEDKVL